MTIRTAFAQAKAYSGTKCFVLQEVLLGVLGREKFGCYAAKLQQLKLCEDSLFGL